MLDLLGHGNDIYRYFALFVKQTITGKHLDDAHKQCGGKNRSAVLALATPTATPQAIDMSQQNCRVIGQLATHIICQLTVTNRFATIGGYMT